MSDGNCEHCNTRADRDRYSDLLDISQGVVRELRAMNAAQHKEHCDTLIELQRINNADLLAAKMGFENQVLHTSEIAAENVRLRAALAEAQEQIAIRDKELREALQMPEGDYPKWKEQVIYELQGSYDTDGITHEDSGDPLVYLQSAIAIVEDSCLPAILATKEGKKDE